MEPLKLPGRNVPPNHAVEGADDDDQPVGRVLSRREVLGLLGGMSAAMIVGTRLPQIARAQAATATPGPTGTAAACVVKPAMTEGPYFVDEKLNRSDIRIEPSDNSVVPGTPLRLKLLVSKVTPGACVPLPGAQVDIWHCDARGVYSDTNDPNWGSSIGKKFLRGYQVTDTLGAVEFLTIYPGWYQGRTVHIHFKIRTDPAASSGYEFTSQFFFDDAFTDAAYTRAPYAQRGARTMRNAEDGIYQGGGDQLTLDVQAADAADTANTAASGGYTATFEIALDLSQPSPTASGPGGDAAGRGPGGRPPGPPPGGGRPGPTPTLAPTKTA